MQGQSLLLGLWVMACLAVVVALNPCVCGGSDCGLLRKPFIPSPWVIGLRFLTSGSPFGSGKNPPTAPLPHQCTAGDHTLSARLSCWRLSYSAVGGP